MASESALFLSGAKVPNLRVRFVGTRAELKPSGRDTEITHRLLVGLKGLEVVQELIPELDDSELVSSYQYILLRRPLHGFHSGIVCLQDVLELELLTIPDRDFPSL
jgi:hypothetical protein